MASPLINATFDLKKKEIEAAQEKVTQRVQNMLYQLQQIKEGSLPNYGITVAPGKPNSQVISRKQELTTNLHKLRSLLQNLSTQERELNRELVRSNALRAQAKNRASMKEILSQAERRGHLTADEEDHLKRQSEQTVQIGLSLLKTNPSQENMKNVLESLSDLWKIAGTSTVGDQALISLADAARKSKERVEKQFRRNPTQENFEKVAKGIAQIQMFGAETTNDSQRPPGLPTIPPGTTHKVGPRETLAQISERYYGKNSYWDVIYFENYAAIGKKVKQLQIGTRLRIP